MQRKLCQKFSEIFASSFEKEEYYIKKFDSSNFTIWKKRMLDVLVNKGLATPLKESRENAYTDD